MDRLILKSHRRSFRERVNITIAWGFPAKSNSSPTTKATFPRRDVRWNSCKSISVAALRTTPDDSKHVMLNEVKHPPVIVPARPVHNFRWIPRSAGNDLYHQS